MRDRAARPLTDTEGQFTMQIHTEETSDRAARIHVGGLDSLRFIAALIVMFGHLGLTRDDDFASTSTFLRAAQMTLGIAFNGPLAVMAFFIISGFVIHLPYRTPTKIALRSFYTRRIVRIALPGAIAFLSGALIGSPTSPPNLAIYWSLVCEVIFYLAYPLLHRIANGSRKRWNTVHAVSCLASATLALTMLDRLRSNQDIHALGVLTALLTFPVWLLGVGLADRYRASAPSLPNNRLILIRGGVVAISAALMVTRFHAGGLLGSNAILLLGVSPLLCLWISAEIRSFSSKSGIARWLDRQGSWSYSLYLCHMLPWPILLAAKIPVDTLPRDVEPLVRIVAAVALSRAFFLVVERPSHSFARFLSKSSVSRTGQEHANLSTGDKTGSSPTIQGKSSLSGPQHQTGELLSPTSHPAMQLSSPPASHALTMLRQTNSLAAEGTAQGTSIATASSQERK